jgi:hypothetical protein
MFENAQFFSHLHLKYAKSATMTQKFFFLKNIIIGIKKTQNFMLISNLHSFLALAFFRGICLSRHQRI